MTNPDWKYTDRDVREGGAELVDLALGYLTRYQGEFDYLLDAKARIRDGRSLTVPQVRGVLNCMRHDTRIDYDLPDPIEPYRRLRVVPDLPRRQMIPVKTRLRGNMWYTTAKRAKWWHLVDHTATDGRYWRLGYYHDRTPCLQVYAYAWCGRQLTSTKHTGLTYNLNQIEALELEFGIAMCPKCKEEMTK